jgi:hypothetical protein
MSGALIRRTEQCCDCQQLRETLRSVESTRILVCDAQRFSAVVHVDDFAIASSVRERERSVSRSRYVISVRLLWSRCFSEAISDMSSRSIVMTQPSRVAKVILVLMALCEGDMASFPAIAASSVGSLE